MDEKNAYIELVKQNRAKHRAKLKIVERNGHRRLE